MRIQHESWQHEISNWLDLSTTHLRCRCHDSIECIEITVREPASALHGPPDHFGPTDASELTRDFVHLGLTNMNKVAGDSLVHITSTESSLISQDTAMEGVPSEPKTLYTGDRTLSLVLPGYIAQEALLFNAFNSCGGLLDLWNKVCYDSLHMDSDINNVCMVMHKSASHHQ